MREMKDSSIPWVGEIPKDWTNKRIKYLLMARDGGSWGTDPTTYNKGTICMRIADFDFDNGEFAKKPVESLTRRVYTKRQIQKLQLQKNDICIEKSGGGEKTPVGRAVIFNKSYLALFANFMDRLRFDSSKVNPVFAEYWFRAWYSCKGSPYYINQTTGIQNINLTLMMSKEKMFFPPVHEQHRITDYLDSKCAKIDSIKENVKAEIEALKQYKQSVITEAVTKGLDKDVEMKDSGIPWIGKIPIKWSINKLKYLFNFGKGLPITKADLINDGAPVISYGQIHAKFNNHVQISKRLIRHVSTHYYKTNPQSLMHKGDFVFADTSEDLDGCGNANYIDIDRPIFAGYHTIILRSKIGSDNRYFGYLFTTDCWRRQIRENVYGIKVFSISKTILARTNIIVPGPDVRKQIADYLDTKCSKIDSIIQKKQELLANLDTYKKSLIYEYVTGKKEVPAV